MIVKYVDGGKQIESEVEEGDSKLVVQLSLGTNNK